VGIGGGFDVPSWVAANSPTIDSKIAVDRPGFGLRFRRWYLATTRYWSHDFASLSASCSCASLAPQILGARNLTASLIDVKSVA
jgi:hypothetical protein